MNTRALAIMTYFSLVCASPWIGSFERLATAQAPSTHVCQPRLDQVPPIELGKAGLFRWTCPPEEGTGRDFYVVFIRPSGTYVLLKVPEGRTTFEFTPDTAGQWRWIVINTDPDRAKPDVESEPGRFEAKPLKDSSD